MKLVELLINQINTNLTEVFVIMQKHSTVKYDTHSSYNINDIPTKDKLHRNVHVTCKEVACKAIVPVTPQAHRCKSCNEIICNKCYNHITNGYAYIGENISYNGKCNTCIWFDLG